MATIADALPGQAISTHNAENVFANGLPWPVVSQTRLPAVAVCAMIQALRFEDGMTSSVSNRVYYAVDDAYDYDSPTATRTVAYTYDGAGFLAVVSI